MTMKMMIMIEVFTVFSRLVSRWGLARGLDRKQKGGTQGGGDHDHYDCDSVIVMTNQIMGGTKGDLKMINVGNISNIIIGTILIIIQDHIALKWQKAQGAGIGM